MRADGLNMDLTEKWKGERERKAFLALDDGTVFHGVAFGARKDALGEVVFNTGMSGYQEILTDPSYAGQFVTLTTAEVGNYGINGADTESRALFLSGLVIGDLTEPSNWRSEKSLDDYLRENGVPGIYGVDTAIARACAWEGLDGQDYAAKVTCKEAYEFDAELANVANVKVLPSPIPSSNGVNQPLAIDNCQLATLSQWQHSHMPHVVCYDFGVKTNILRSLAAWAKVTVVPAQTSAEDVLALNPDGIFLSNGPADPAAVTYAIENIRKLLGIENPIPIMGICLGHQLLSLACGAKTARLKFGHHGCNHPVKNLATGKVEITSQNHNFAVDPATLPDCLEVSHVNLNDGTIEGVRHKTLPAFSVQYHPESCPGPHDSAYLFNGFKELVTK